MPDPAVPVVEAPVVAADPAVVSLAEYRKGPAEPAETVDETPAVEAEPEVKEPAAEPDATAAGKALAAKKGSLQARINEITAEKHSTAAERDAAKAEAAALRAELATLKGGKPAEAPATAAPAVSSGKPELKDFADYDAYNEALVDWKLEQRAAKAAADADAATQAAAKTSAAAEQQTRFDAWTARRDAFAATEPAFTEHAMPFLDKVRAGTPIGDALIESEQGPQLALHLATHPEDATRITGLPWRQAIFALGTLAAAIGAPAKPVAPVVTKAPAPVVPPHNGAVDSTPNPENMTSIAAWRKNRHKFDEMAA